MENLKFAQLGNALMISDHILEETKLALFNPDSNTYETFEDLTPDLPVVQFQAVHNVAKDNIETSESYALGSEQSWEPAKRGEYLKMMGKQLKNKLFVGRYLVRCAWELFDGTIVKHSIPVYVEASTIIQAWFAAGSNVTYTTRFTGNEIQFKITGITSTLASIKTKYKNIVKGLNIYFTPTYRPALLRNEEHFGFAPGYFFPSGFSLTKDPITEDVYTPDITQKGYYLVDQINLEDLTDDWMTLTPDDLTSIETMSAMTVDDFTHHKLHGKSLYSYNQRIFLGNIKNTLFAGYAASSFFSGVGSVGPGYDVGIEIDILTHQGTKTVFSGWTSLNTYTGTNLLYPQFQSAGSNNSYWGYPDARAKQARLLIQKSGVIYHVDTIQFDHLQDLNISYRQGALMIVSHALSYYPVYALKVGLNSYWDNDRVQACGFQNPFVFPAENSYNVQGFVLGMATNAKPLSQGQFGQYPLFVLTSQGVWAMNIGRGEILIDSITPLSGVVCSNVDSIKGIDGGVVFVAQEGLIILIGQNPVEISEEAEGIYLSPMAGDVTFEGIINNLITYAPKPYLCNTDFKTYLADAIIAYNPVEKEIIVCNPNKAYSWVFSIVNKGWFKLSKSWVSFVEDHPKAWGYVQVSGTWYADDLTRENVNEIVMVHLETRPVKFADVVSFKKLHRMGLLGSIRPQDGKPFGIWLFGSVDNENYYVMNASQLLAPAPATLIIGRSSHSCKSFILVIGGLVYDDSTILGVVADVEKKWMQKIR